MKDYPLLMNKLPITIKKVWHLSNLIGTVIMLVVGVALVIGLHLFNWWSPLWFWLALGYFIVIILLGIGGALLVPYRYAFHRYEVSSDDLAFQDGYFFRHITYVPINRIQHIETTQGPLLRHEDLMELVIQTAATRHKISGLTVESATTMREHIIELVKVAKEDV